MADDRRLTGPGTARETIDKMVQEVARLQEGNKVGDILDKRLDDIIEALSTTRGHFNRGDFVPPIADVLPQFRDLPFIQQGKNVGVPFNVGRRATDAPLRLIKGGFVAPLSALDFALDATPASDESEQLREAEMRGQSMFQEALKRRLQDAQGQEMVLP